MKYLRGCWLARLIACALLISTMSCLSQQAKSANPVDRMRAALMQLAQATPDDCGWDGPAPALHAVDTATPENAFFAASDDVLVQALNTPGSTPAQQVAKVLEAEKAMSDEVDRTWPPNRRLTYEVLQADPIFVVTYHLRSRSTWTAFGIPQQSAWPKRGENTDWVRIEEDSSRYDAVDTDQEMRVDRLTRGPLRRARFLATSSHVSCGDGITAITYDAFEWDPAGMGDLSNVIERKGAGSRGDFPQYGPFAKLEVNGPIITLPYCEWSAVDLDVDALLCMADTYSLAGDEVHYLNTRVNRPDLAAVAKAMQYAEDRDYRAVLAYSASPAVARKMVRMMPPDVHGNTGGTGYPTLGSKREVIDIDSLHFTVEQRHGRWVVVRFTLDPD